MYQLERGDVTGVISLTATGSTPVELVQSALEGVLAVARGDGPTGGEAGAAAVPFRGEGSGLEPLVLDLVDDMISQMEEFGTGLDEVRLDGLLRTDTGGFTAWGYLSGDPDRQESAPIPHAIANLVIVEAGDELRLTCDLLPENG